MACGSAWRGVACHSGVACEASELAHPRQQGCMQHGVVWCGDMAKTCAAVLAGGGTCVACMASRGNLEAGDLHRHGVRWQVGGIPIVLQSPKGLEKKKKKT
jgi:hypothetical protein